MWRSVRRTRGGLASARPETVQVSADTPAPNGLFDKRLLFVTGKGGVGKTTVAAAMARFAAASGKRTLLCAMERPADLSTALGCGPLSYEPQLIAENLAAIEMDTEAALREYLRVQVHLPPIGRIGPLAEAFDFLATAAPGVREILTIGKLCYEVRERHYDLIITDAAASGHVVGHLAAPVGIDELAGVGVIANQTAWMLEILEDPLTTGVVVVTTAEEMPVNESMELIDRLSSETNIALCAVVANRVPPQLFSDREADVFTSLQALLETPKSVALDETERAALESLLDAASRAQHLRLNASAQLDRLRSDLSDSDELLFLPRVFDAKDGAEITARLSLHLADEVGG